MNDDLHETKKKYDFYSCEHDECIPPAEFKTGGFPVLGAHSASGFARVSSVTSDKTRRGRIPRLKLRSPDICRCPILPQHTSMGNPSGARRSCRIRSCSSVTPTHIMHHQTLTNRNRQNEQRRHSDGAFNLTSE